MRHSEILDFIETLRGSFDNSVEVFTRGSCYRLAKMLKIAFPEGEIMTNTAHATFRYDGVMYDIEGIVDEEAHKKEYEVSYIPLVGNYTDESIKKRLKLRYQ